MMTHPFRRRFDTWNMATKIGTAILTCAAVVTLCWELLAAPCIQQQIEKTTNPIVDALEFQTFLMMQNLTDAQIKRATDSYTAAQKVRVKRQ
jgi:hypothetical protein